MRHRKLGRQFSRNTSHRKAMFRALTANLVLHERIETTEAKAKELRRIAERLISSARRLGPVAYTAWDELSAADRSKRLAAKRHVGKFLRRIGVVETEEQSARVDLVEKVFSDLAKRYAERPGGYTRIIKLGRRRGDNAPMSMIELVDRPGGVNGAATDTEGAAANGAANAEGAAADPEATASVATTASAETSVAATAVAASLPSTESESAEEVPAKAAK
jgi:large subunit ribosomal protein L17